MAYIKTDAILARIRELIHDGFGTLRTIDATRFTTGLHEGHVAEHRSRISRLTQKPAEVSIPRQRRHPQSLTVAGSIQIMALDVEIRVERSLVFEGRNDEDAREAVRALAAQDSDALRQVLEWPRNLATTEAGVSTDLKALVFQESRTRVVGESGKAMRLDSVHAFLGTALARPA
jgi:hypothetical protein